jgi:O-antigen/teichoic acid export membrane protein
MRNDKELIFSSMPTINKTRIAKNTALLYFRQLLILLIQIYTLRVLLNVLGATDYGTYDVIGGIIAMLGFLNSTMATASQRFFAIELGMENHTKLKQVFSINVLIFIVLALLILIVGETAGLWYFYHKIEIPPERWEAAAWVYQFTIFSAMAGIITTPFLAIITAHEKMNVYAYLSILEVAFKLAIVFVLIYFPSDKLKLYAVLLFAVQMLISALYMTYSVSKFPECKLKYYWNKTMFKEVLSFAGWNLYGVMAMTVRTQGIKLILNKFFGVLLNAAQGVASYVYMALIRFTDSFFTAVRPQIIKSYSVDKEDTSGEMMKLVFQSSKFCFYLIIVLSIPILIETPAILSIWLKGVVPEFSVVFTRLMAVNAIIESLANPFITSIQATGKIKRYQLVTGTIVLFIIPVSYLFYKMGFPPQTILYIMISITIIAYFSRIYFMKSLLRMNIFSYFKQVLLPVLAVTVLAFALPLLYSYSFNPSFWRIVGVCAVTVISSAIVIYSVGLTKSERNGLKKFVVSKIKKN